MPERFAIEKLEGGVRFQASDGWVDLRLYDDGRASLWLGTHNGTVPEAFAGRLWHLLHDAMPAMGLRVVSAEVPRETGPQGFVEVILVHAGFSLDGVRRSWAVGDGLADLAIYSILDSEVAYEAHTPERVNGTAVEETKP